jgi:hypothetical protein
MLRNSFYSTVEIATAQEIIFIIIPGSVCVFFSEIANLSHWKDNTNLLHDKEELSEISSFNINHYWKINH